ncbi:hypothetical protein JJQ59_04715 [Cupriavidus necator]|uniref:hypothetical protein n=1 Tax=Cupriavidus necator TaxID=106590 RepID=UPI00167425DA|nr:hypothetical protein [Cupriavidus necator]QQX85250.1 hypothetical protein JJQ59_04715 [Cupriavidus necator]
MHLAAYFGGSALLFSAYFYFYAWILLHFYFQAFGISLVSLDIPFYYHLVYASTAIGQSDGFIFVVVIAGAALYVILDRSWASDSKPWVSIAHKLLFVIFLLCVLAGGFHAAKWQGVGLAQDVRDGKHLRQLKLAFKKDAGKKLSDIFKTSIREGMLSEGETLQVKLLIETKDTYYVFVQKVKDEKYYGYGNTYLIQKKDVSYAVLEVPDETRQVSPSKDCDFASWCHVKATLLGE